MTVARRNAAARIVPLDLACLCGFVSPRRRILLSTPPPRLVCRSSIVCCRLSRHRLSAPNPTRRARTSAVMGSAMPVPLSPRPSPPPRSPSWRASDSRSRMCASQTRRNRDPRQPPVSLSPSRPPPRPRSRCPTSADATRAFVSRAQPPPPRVEARDSTSGRRMRSRRPRAHPPARPRGTARRPPSSSSISSRLRPIPTDANGTIHRRIRPVRRSRVRLRLHRPSPVALVVVVVVVVVVAHDPSRDKVGREVSVSVSVSVSSTFSSIRGDLPSYHPVGTPHRPPPRRRARRVGRLRGELARASTRRRGVFACRRL